MMLRRRAMLGCGGSLSYIAEEFGSMELLWTHDINEAATWYYGDGFTFDSSTGLFTLVNPQKVLITAANYQEQGAFILGKYISYSDGPEVDVYFIPANSTVELTEFTDTATIYVVDVVGTLVIYYVPN